MLITSCGEKREIRLWHYQETGTVHLAHTFHLDECVRDIDIRNIYSSQIACSPTFDGTGIIVFMEANLSCRMGKWSSIFSIDIESRQCVHYESCLSEGGRVALCVSKSGDRFAVFTGHCLKMWKPSIETDSSLWSLESDFAGSKAMCFCDINGVFVKGDSDAIVLFNVNDGSEIRRIQCRVTSMGATVVGAVCTSISQALVAASAAGGMFVFETQNWSQLVGWTGAASNHALEFSADEDWLLGCCEDLSVFIWNSRTGIPLVNFKGCIITACWFSPDMKVAVSTEDSEGDMMKVLDAATGLDICRWVPHGGSRALICGVVRPAMNILL
jgi:WD40 repeat protein